MLLSYASLPPRRGIGADSCSPGPYYNAAASYWPPSSDEITRPEASGAPLQLNFPNATVGISPPYQTLDARGFSPRGSSQSTENSLNDGGYSSLPINENKKQCLSGFRCPLEQSNGFRTPGYQQAPFCVQGKFHPNVFTPGTQRFQLRNHVERPHADLRDGENHMKQKSPSPHPVAQVPPPKQIKRSFRHDAPNPEYYLETPFSVGAESFTSPMLLECHSIPQPISPGESCTIIPSNASHSRFKACTLQGDASQHLFDLSPNNAPPAAPQPQVPSYPNLPSNKRLPESNKKITIDTSVAIPILNTSNQISPTSPLTPSDTLTQISKTVAILVMALWEEEGFKLCEQQLSYGPDPGFTRFSHFVNFLIRASGVPFSTVVLASKYLIRLSKSKNKIPVNSPLLSHKFPKKARYSPGYIILVVILILANKYCDDYKVKNSYWSTLTFIQLGVINRAEFDSLKALSFNLYVGESEYSDTSLALLLVSRYYEDFDNCVRSNSSTQALAAALRRLLTVLNSLK